MYGKFNRTPYFLKWSTFFKLSGPFVPIDLISGQNPFTVESFHEVRKGIVENVGKPLIKPIHQKQDLVSMKCVGHMFASFYTPPTTKWRGNTGIVKAVHLSVRGHNFFRSFSSTVLHILL